MLKGILSALSGLGDRLHGMAAGTGFTRLDPAFPQYVGGGGIGGWASNHWTESKLITGRAFTNIRAVARTCAKAVPQVLAVGGRFERTMRRAKSLHHQGRISSDVYRRVKAAVQASGDGGDAVPVSKLHPFQRLLNRPNPWMTRSQFLYQHAQQACATGTTLMWTRRNNWREGDPRGVPGQLFIIPTAICNPQPPSALAPMGYYQIMPVGGFGGLRGPAADPWGDHSWSNLMLSGGQLDAREVRPMRWPHPLFLCDGQSPMDAGKDWLDIGTQLDRATWYGLRNTLRPGYIFQMATGFEEPSLGESIRFDREIASRIAGLDNVGRHMRLPKGIEIADADRSVQELGWIDGRQVIAGDIATLWAVHPVVTGQQPAGAYAAYVAAMIAFMEQAVEPVLALLADEWQDELAEGFGGELEVRLPAPKVHDQQQAMAEMQLRIDARCVSYNQVRKAYGDEPWGDWADLPVGSAAVDQLAAADLGIELPEVLANNGPSPQTEPGARNRPNQPPPAAGGGPDRPRGPGDRSPAARNKPRAGPATGKVSDVSTSRRKDVAQVVPAFIPGDARLNGFHSAKGRRR